MGIIKLFLAREDCFNDIPAGDEKNANLFHSVAELLKENIQSMVFTPWIYLSKTFS
jgi:hypothetical protein